MNRKKKEKSNFNIQFTSSDSMPNLKKFIEELTLSVRKKIIHTLECNFQDLNEIHPRTLINMIASHIVINLSHSVMNEFITPRMKQEAMNELIDELSAMIRFMWRAIDTLAADETVAN
ncbi:MAG TPA: hypothetical protein VHZ76_07205 [Gammaproteobacteria bacterium]|jgi:hypothetical protein|nr:hypothetical protein [Gammaproteobacteria bacterium]